MTEPLSLLTALLLGLFGASHCLVMCGGVAAAAGQLDTQHRVRASLLFNFGRITSYTLAGLIVGSLGLWLSSLHEALMITLRSIAGLMLILMGLYVARWALWLTRIEQIGQLFWRRVQPHAQKRLGRSDPASQWLLGMLWGWLPCGLIYSTLSWVAANGQPAMGALTMFVFGLGTFPAILSAGLASASVMNIIRHQWARNIAGLLLIGYGCWTLASVWHPAMFAAA